MTEFEQWATRIGALTGFIAFLFRAVEFYLDRRPRLNVEAALTGDPAIGNTILVLNSSKVPTNIYSYSLEALPPTWLNRRFQRFTGWENVEFSLEADTANIPVPAHGQAALHFREQDHFYWGARRKDDLYLRLWIVGRGRSLNFLVVRAGGR
jgi:hypothetical protein